MSLLLARQTPSVTYNIAAAQAPAIYAVPALQVQFAMEAAQAPTATPAVEQNQAVVTANFSVGNAASRVALAQSFRAPGSYAITGVQLNVRRIGSPTDSLRVAVCADNAGKPGTELGSATILGSSLGTSFALSLFSILGAQITAGVTYWIKVSRTGALDSVNNYEWAGESSDVYANGNYSSFDGTTWFADTSRDLNFIVTFAQSEPYPALQLTFAVPAAQAPASGRSSTMALSFAMPAASAPGAAPTPTLAATFAVPAAQAPASAPAAQLSAAFEVPAASSSGSATTPALQVKFDMAAATASATFPPPTWITGDGFAYDVPAASATATFAPPTWTADDGSTPAGGRARPRYVDARSVKTIRVQPGVKNLLYAMEPARSTATMPLPKLEVDDTPLLLELAAIAALL